MDTTTEKVGRNEPCPCGSGKKHKKCCLLARNSGPKAQESQPALPVPPTYEFPINTFPGEAAAITMVPFFALGDPRNTDNPNGAPGEYRVTIVLGRPGRFETGERSYHFSDQLVGNSHIAITRPAIEPRVMPDAVGIRIRVQIDAGAFTFNGKPNAEGYLGKLISEPFRAENFDDAMRRAYHAVAPSLSNWSVHLDVPVYVAQVDATELRTGAARAQVFTPALEAKFAVAAEPRLESEFLYYAGLYREALNSNSPAYRFLCLYKIIEGVRLRRERLAREARNIGHEPERFKFEEIPVENSVLALWLNSVYGVREWQPLALEQVAPADVRGRRFSQIIQSKLASLRNEVAHAILDSGELGMSVDDMFKIERVNLLLPLTRTIARRMLKNSFRDHFMVHLSDPLHTEGVDSRSIERPHNDPL